MTPTMRSGLAIAVTAVLLGAIPGGASAAQGAPVVATVKNSAPANSALMAGVPDWAVEAIVRSKLRENEFYAVSDGVIMVPPASDPSLVTLSGVTRASTAALSPPSQDDINLYPVVDLDAPVDADANLDDTDPEITTSASAASPWRPCGTNDSKYKLVHDYGRQTMSGITGRSAHLKCGTTANWSYWHIKARHQNDWQRKANLVGSGWVDFANWSFTQSLSHPCSRTRRLSNDTLQYVARIQIRDRNNRLVAQFGSRVSVARRSQNIITAFPESQLVC